MGQVLKYFGLLLLVIVVGFGAMTWAPDQGVEELSERWAQPPSKFLDVAGMAVHLRDEGPRDAGVPVILIHGTGSSLHTWDGWAAALKEEHRVIRFDLPGYGLTGPHPDDNYRIKAYTDFVIAMLDALDVERAVLAGNSLGGHIAWATAVLHPQRVEKLVLVDASGYPFEPASIPIGFRLAQMPVINVLLRPFLPRAIVRQSVENVFGDPSQVTPALVDRYFDLTTREGNREALTVRMRQLDLEAFNERIPEIQQPTLIIWGRKDRLIPEDAGARFLEDIENSTYVGFNDLGHIPHEEAPERTVQPVLEFVASTAR